MRHKSLLIAVTGVVFATVPLLGQLPATSRAEASQTSHASEPGAPLETPYANAVVPSTAGAQSASQAAQATAADSAELNGTVTDADDDLIPGATVVLDGATAGDRRSAVANDSGFFQFTGLKAGIPYHLTISSKGFENWSSPSITLAPGQFYGVAGIKLKLEGGVSSVTVYSSTEEIAAHQVELEEKQRVFGFIPNFYVVYDSKNAVAMTTKLKFKMAMRVSIDPVSIVGAAALSGMNQAGDTPNYRQGTIGYAERFGAVYADGLTDIMIGGAILPSLLHQDPRYFYQGGGGTKSRLMHAISSPFICRGDNGHLEPNISSLGGDLASSAISNVYYPASNRGAALVFDNFALSTGERMVSAMIQEFVLRKLTPSANREE